MSKRVSLTSRFRSDYASIKRDRPARSAVDAAMKKIAHGVKLPLSYCDRELSPKMRGHRVCFVGEGTSLVYKLTDDVVCFSLLERTPSAPENQLEEAADLSQLDDEPVREAPSAPLAHKLDVPDPLLDPAVCSAAPRWQMELPLYKALKLSNSVERALRSLNCYTIGDLTGVSTAEFLTYKGVGLATVEHLRGAVERDAFTLSGREGIPEQTLSILGDSYRVESQLFSPITFQGCLSDLAEALTRCPKTEDYPIDVTQMRASLFEETRSWANSPHDTLGDLMGSRLLAAREAASGICSVLAYSKSLCAGAGTLYQLIAQCVIDAKKNISTDQIKLFSLSIGTSGEPMTRRKIEKLTGVSESSVQHGIRRVSQHCDLSKSIRFVYPRLVVLDEALRMGGSGRTDLLGAELAKRLQDESFSNLPIVTPDLQLSKGRESFEIKGLPCRSCQGLAAALRSLGSQGSALDITELTLAAGCSSCETGLTPGSDLAQSVASSLRGRGELKAKKQTDQPSLRPGSVQEAIRRTLFDADTPITSRDLMQGIKELTGKNVLMHTIPKRVALLKDCMVWGRGEYIHERHVSVREEVVDDMVEAAVRIFAEKDTPIFWVGGLFEKNIDYLVSEGIPNEFALHSILRRRNDPRLDLRVSPWVSKAGTAGERGNLKERFMQVMEEHGNFMTNDEVTDFRKRTLAPYYAVNNIEKCTPGIEKQPDGWLYTPPQEG